ncbi:hypothetical protein M231_01979 [Tremella mesenterica]|uniref:C2H2-type domain-containing protein n=1 Tax=Tremella mesenterica TaxID=5217 RepID=A0A4V1M4K9_TREME|nr:hypothetical protein M231_01979 [Tremella mesenterica]
MPPGPPARYDRERDDRDRREFPIRDRDRDFPRRDLDPDPDLERWERRLDRDDYERGRGFSSEPYDRGKRRRSPSPGGPSHRARLYSPSPPRPPPPPQHKLPDPASLDYLLNFRQFSEWFRAEHPMTAQQDHEEVAKRQEEAEQTGTVLREKVGMAKRYERYRKEYHSRQLYALFLTHRDSPWFKEKYSNDREYVALRKRWSKEGRTLTSIVYAAKLKNGEMDDVSFDLTGEVALPRASFTAHETEDTEKHGIHRRGIQEHDEPDGLDRALDEAPQDDAMRMEVAPKERQIFVKTVPPSSSRRELEELFAQCEGFQYLALTEPQIKKSFHRVAWAQFAEGVDVKEVVDKLDGSKLDNFTFHMGVNSAPVLGRIRVTHPIANTLERLEIDGENAQQLALKFEAEMAAQGPITRAPDSTEREEKVKGETGEEKSVKVEGVQANHMKADETPISNPPEKISDLVQATIDRVLDSEGLTSKGLNQEQQIRKAKIILDQWISYLRNGLSTCYYCVAPMVFPEELQRKCIAHMRPRILEPPELASNKEASNSPTPEFKDAKEELDVKMETENGEVPSNGVKAEPMDVSGIAGEEPEREVRDDETKLVDSPMKKSKLHDRLAPKRSSDERWVESLETKLKPLLGEVNVTEYGGRDLEEETKRLAAPLIRQEEVSKYRCKECNKLFKAPEYVMKHVLSKHTEIAKPRLDELAEFNNFVLDPQRLQPSAQTPVTVDDRLPPKPVFNPSLPLPLPMPMNMPMNQNGLQGQNGFPPNPVMQQQMMMMLQMQQMMMAAQGGINPLGAVGPGGMGIPGQSLAQRMGGFAPNNTRPGRVGTGGGTGLAIPMGGEEDPRARRGRVSYKDLDEVESGVGDGGLPY